MGKSIKVSKEDLDKMKQDWWLEGYKTGWLAPNEMDFSYCVKQDFDKFVKNSNK